VSHDSIVDSDWLPATDWCHHYVVLYYTILSYGRRKKFGGGIHVWSVHPRGKTLN